MPAYRLGAVGAPGSAASRMPSLEAAVEQLDRGIQSRTALVAEVAVLM